jgi:hypothetical protein
MDSWCLYLKHYNAINRVVFKRNQAFERAECLIEIRYL